MSENKINKNNHEEYGDYIAKRSIKVLHAIEDIFEKSTPPPAGCDMIDTIAFTSVVFFARQIALQYDDKKIRRSMMRSMMNSLKCQILSLAETIIKSDLPWDGLFDEENV